MGKADPSPAQPATAGKGISHIPQLDGIRAIAVGMVVIAHSGFDRIVPGGLGVTIFFFLSGYLITTLLRSEYATDGFIDLKQFYIRRTLRIWPPLYITMVFNGILAIALSYTGRVSPLGVLSQLLFVTNYTETIANLHGVPYAPLWSLAVEEHFYLLFPILFILLIGRIGPKGLGYVCMAACAVALVVRLWSIHAGVSYDDVYEWSHTRYDSIVFGCVLALWQNPLLDTNAWRPRIWQFGIAIFVMLATLVIRNPAAQQTIRYTLQGASLFVIFSYVLVDKGVITHFLTMRPMRLLGLYSYTFYLCHQSFIAIVGAFHVTRPILLLLLATPLTWGYAWAMYRLVEQPLARWRRSLRRTDREATTVEV
jgi:peptidoglycan/LPS O-acetylase OafA/YrhL